MTLSRALSSCASALAIHSTMVCAMRVVFDVLRILSVLQYYCYCHVLPLVLVLLLRLLLRWCVLRPWLILALGARLQTWRFCRLKGFACLL